MMTINYDFSGAVVLVVGATGAIGSETARRFANAGARLVLAGRDGRAGAALQAELGESAVFVPCDVTDPAAHDRAVAAAVQNFGQLDIAFNNAGWEGTGAAAADTAEADWLRMMDVKLNGTWRGLKAQARQMLAQGGSGGSIVNMAGSWGLVGAAGQAAYCAAAHGVMGLTRAAALDYAGAAIRVNAVCPGAVDTPMLARMFGGNAAALAGYAASLPMGRTATPADVAGAVLWLCSADAGYVTGQGVGIAGGA
jgi:NAD(P)-dependent dehydrogenase (short-subunit alcohol dehydrogenase family)